MPDCTARWLMESLPIDEILPQIIDRLSEAGAVVLKAEPGAGKTTRVPPAILNAGLADGGNGASGARGVSTVKGLRDVPGVNGAGQIVVLQPRRVAARAAAARMSDERGTALGADIGYRVRHEGKSSRQTRILVCTEGIFLRRLQDDPSIEDVSVVVFDEFHERSINSDLALALTAQVRRDLRPDLKIVVMSATLDSKPICAFLGDCLSVESPGKTFPVAVDYLKFSSSASIEDLAVDGVGQIIGRTARDVLVFLPGVGEIRETQARLETKFAGDTLVMPLYGEMALQEQLDVLRPRKERKVVLATNVAETSLTIDGITAVVDSGFARVNKFDPNIGVNQLMLSRISKASAAQRTGRAGRTAPGECLRLWTERENMSLSDYELPEIERVDLSECILQLFAWGERDVFEFPWFEKPSRKTMENAIELLERLDAIRGGNLTELGKEMARFPLQPRFSRMLIEGAHLGHPQRAALCAAVLSERPPFRKIDESMVGAHRTDSDILEQVRALEEFDRNGTRDSIMGGIIPGAAKHVLRTGSQLARLFDDAGEKIFAKSETVSAKSETVSAKSDKASTKSEKASTKSDDKLGADEAVLRAVMAAFPDRICKRRQTKDKRAIMVGGKGVALSDQSFVLDSPLFAAVDLVDLNKSDLMVRRASGVERNWLPESQVQTSIDVVYDAEREKVIALKRVKFCDLILDESISKIPAEVDPGIILAEAVAANFALSTLIDKDSMEYLERVMCLREWLPELEIADFGPEPWKTFLPALCCGSVSVGELRSKSMIAAIQSQLTHEQLMAVEREAPETIAIPTGRKVKLQYEQGKKPVLAARIQELFGLRETPRVARSRVPVMLHLLAPNYRPQQVTDDLASFWKNTYPQVKKDLKGRYPKHKWPDDPYTPLEPRK